MEQKLRERLDRDFVLGWVDAPDAWREWQDDVIQIVRKADLVLGPKADGGSGRSEPSLCND